MLFYQITNNINLFLIRPYLREFKLKLFFFLRTLNLMVILISNLRKSTNKQKHLLCKISDTISKIGFIQTFFEEEELNRKIYRLYFFSEKKLFQSQTFPTFSHLPDAAAEKTKEKPLTNSI